MREGQPLPFQACLWGRGRRGVLSSDVGFVDASKNCSSMSSSQTVLSVDAQSIRNNTAQRQHCRRGEQRRASIMMSRHHANASTHCNHMDQMSQQICLILNMHVILP